MRFIGAILFIQKLSISKTMWFVLLLIAVSAVWFLSIHPAYTIENGSITQVRILMHTEAGTTQLRDYYTIYVTILMLVGSFIIASIVPGLLSGGNLAFLTVKPLSRTEIFISCYIVGLSFLGTVFLLFFIGNWLAMGIQYGYWKINYITGYFIVLYFIAILYAYIILFGILLRNGPLAIIFVFLFGFVLPIVLELRERIIYPLFDSDIVHLMIEGVYYVLPPTTDLLGMSIKVTFLEPIELSHLWNGIAIVPLFVISIIFFKNKSF